MLFQNVAHESKEWGTLWCLNVCELFLKASPDKREDTQGRRNQVRRRDQWYNIFSFHQYTQPVRLDSPFLRNRYRKRISLIVLLGFWISQLRFTAVKKKTNKTRHWMDLWNRGFCLVCVKVQQWRGRRGSLCSAQTSGDSDLLYVSALREKASGRRQGWRLAWRALLGR